MASRYIVAGDISSTDVQGKNRVYISRAIVLPCYLIVLLKKNKINFNKSFTIVL